MKGAVLHVSSSWTPTLGHTFITKPPTWLALAPQHLPVSEQRHPGLAACWQHDAHGLQIQPAGLHGGWLPEEAADPAGGWYTNEPVCRPGGETGAAEALEHFGLFPEDPSLQLPVRPGCNVPHYGFLHPDRRQEGSPTDAVPVSLQQSGQPGTFCLQPLLRQGLCTYQTGGEVHHIQGGVSQPAAASRAQSAGE